MLFTTENKGPTKPHQRTASLTVSGLQQWLLCQSSMQQSNASGTSITTCNSKISSFLLLCWLRAHVNPQSSVSPLNSPRLPKYINFSSASPRNGFYEQFYGLSVFLIFSFRKIFKTSKFLKHLHTPTTGTYIVIYSINK